MEDLGQIAADTTGDGRGGDIQLQVGTLALASGAQITSGSGLEVEDTIVVGTGQGGRLIITVGDVVSIAGENSGLFSNTLGAGRGGDITLQARELRLTEGGVISAASSSAGDAGSLRLQIGETFRSDHGRVTATAARGAGGNIQLTAGSLTQLIGSEVTAFSVGGREGNITLDSPLLVLAGSQIIANAFAGPGGNVVIHAGVLLADPASLISASGTLGLTGAVTGLTESVAFFPQTFMSVAALLPVRCAARAPGGRYSSLVLGGRDGLPDDPSGVLSSPLALDERLGANPTLTGESHRPTAAARFALLTGHEKALPRLAGACAK
jgi:hypothetical protein